MIAESKLRSKLNLIMKRMRYERMWYVKRADAEGRRVAPTLSEVMIPLLSTATQHPPQEVAGTKRAATAAPISPPSSSLVAHA